MAEVDDLIFSCSSFGEFSATYNSLIARLPADSRQRLREIHQNYCAGYGFRGAFLRMNGKTISEIFAEFGPANLKLVASGENDGTNFQLYEPPASVENDSVDEPTKTPGE